MIASIFKRDSNLKSIAENDPIERQRYVLFVLFSIVAILTSVLIFLQATLINHLVAYQRYFPFLMLLFAVILALNYFAFQKHRNTHFAYISIIIIASAILHFFCYFTGGIYAPANFYLAVFEITAFMLLGSTGGWLYFGFSVVHLLWMYYATSYTSLISNYHKEDTFGIYLSTAINATIAVGAITLLCNSISKSTTMIIKAMNKSQENLVSYMDTLEKTNEELDRFAYIVSHDLKAPLRAIDNLSQWIEEDSAGKLNEESVENLQLLRSRVRRMDSLITGILEYSKINRKKTIKELVPVEEIIQETLLLLVPPANFTLNILSALPTLQVDMIKIQQVFANLIGNAIKYNDKENIIVDIECTEKANEWEFSISDNGPGIEPQHYERVFLIFQTLQSRDITDSAGVGLAIVKKIIEEQGGAINIKSEPGMGASFIFTIPKAKPASLKPKLSNRILASVA